MLLVAGAVIAVIYAALAAVGPASGEIERFLSAWHPSRPELTHPSELINLNALIRFPWGWVPISSAIAEATAGVIIVLRDRR